MNGNLLSSPPLLGAEQRARAPELPAAACGGIEGARKVENGGARSKCETRPSVKIGDPRGLVPWPSEDEAMAEARAA